MYEADWTNLPYGHMKKHEPWGEPRKMNFTLVYLLDCLREKLGIPLWVTYGTQGWHKAPWHARGLAVDAVIDAALIKPLDAILTITRFPFKGFGIILDAKHWACNQPLGLHLDIRPTKRPSDPQARWLWYHNKEHAFNAESLRDAGLI